MPAGVRKLAVLVVLVIALSASGTHAATFSARTRSEAASGSTTRTCSAWELLAHNGGLYATAPAGMINVFEPFSPRLSGGCPAHRSISCRSQSRSRGCHRVSTTGAVTGTPASTTGEFSGTGSQAVSSATNVVEPRAMVLPPTVTAVSPTSGPAAGGDTVTVTGTNLTGATAVHFGSQPAISFSVSSSTTLTAVAPAGTGTVDITVTVDAQTSATGVADEYSYITAPTVTAVTPTSGPSAGGTTVTVTGTNLTGATAVEFGTVPATSFTVDSNTQLTAVAPAGTGTVDITVTVDGETSAPSSADQYTYLSPPAVTAVSPTSGSAASGTTVTVTGTNLTGATAVEFGTVPATSFTVDSNTQLTAVAPAGTGTVNITVASPGGISATGAADQYTYGALTPGEATVTPQAPSVLGSTAAGFSGSVDPNGSPTTAQFEYGIAEGLRAVPGPTYDQTTPEQTVGSDFSEHQITTKATGLIPNALYHVRLVATNAAGTVYGPDQTFTTAEDPPPPAPTLGKTFDTEPVSGHVFIKVPSRHSLYAVRQAIATNAKPTTGTGFLPLTEPRSIPVGSLIDSRAGTLTLVTAPSTRRRGLERGTFDGAIFSVDQTAKGVLKGLTTLSLRENAFPGSPGYASCHTHAHTAGAAAGPAPTSAVAPVFRDPFAGLAGPSPVVQTLGARDNHGQFRTRGRYSAGTVRGTVWDTSDRCDGTLTFVKRGTVDVYSYSLRKTIVVHAGHSYLAPPPAHKRKPRG